jgi:two-component system cell cycle sensor histidine kinase/response regulator CckA
VERDSRPDQSLPSRGPRRARDSGSREALERAGTTYRDLVEQVPLMIYVDEANVEASSIYISPQTTEMLGYTPEQWAADPDFFLKVLHPDDRERVVAEHAHTVATGEALRTEYRIITPEGREIWVRDEASLVRDADGKPMCLQGCLLDITDRKERETAVRESEARTRAMLDAALDAVITIDHEGTIIEFNPAAERVFGYARAEALGREMPSLLVPASLREAHARGFRRYLETGEAAVLGKRLELPALRADGTEVPIELSIVRVDLPGPPVFTAYARDIKERRRSEALVAGQACLLELIAEGAPLHAVLDRLARFIEEQSGDALASILLVDRDGLHLRHGAAPSLPADYCQAIDGVPIGPEQGSCGTAAHRREPVAVSDIEHDPLWNLHRVVALATGLRACWSTPILANDDTLLGTFAVYYREAREPSEGDLQLVELASQIGRIAIERSRSEALLRASENRYRDLFHNASDMIVTVDLDWNITAANTAVAETLGYSTTELLEMNLAELLPPEMHELARNQLTRKLSSEVEVTTYEHDFVAKDGHRIAVEVTTKVVFQDGVPLGVEAVARDVSERNRLEDQLRQAQKMEAVGRLAGGVAHDFNNMMTAVVGFSDLVLGRLEPDHPARRQVEDIRRAGARATELTRQLLALSRKQVLQPRVLDLNAVVTETQTLLRRLIGEHIELRSALDPDLGLVRADAGQLQQVVMNLVVNARDAMPDGGTLTLETRNVALDEASAAGLVDLPPGDYVLLSVADTGTGMDAQTRARVFEPFFTTKEEGKGTGLGLATVYGIIKQSDGDITVRSEPGLGTAFELYLPRATEADGSAAPQDRTATRTPHGSEVILLVEDEDVVRNLERQILEQNGYTVLEARTPGHAIELCDGHDGPIHLLLTDVVMPELSGRELADRLTPSRPGLKVLYASGYADGAIVRHGILESGTAFIPKPLTPSSLARKVREVLDTPKAA